MTPGKFLRLIWPSTGFYCIAHPFKPNGSATTVYVHKVFATIGEAVTYVHEQQHVQDTYFAVLSLEQEKVWDPNKTDYKTGQPGAWAQRLQSNMLASKCSFFDLDVGNDPKKYADQAQALGDLKRFLDDTLLPMPTMISSGGGIHVYWHYDADVPALEWRDLAWKLRLLAEHLQLRVDPTRTIDTSSVLRVVDTFNWKDRNNPRPVKALQEGAITPFATFKTLVSDALIKHGVTITPTPQKAAAPAAAAASPLGKQTFNDFGPPPKLEAVSKGCAQMREMIRSQGDKSHPSYGPLDNTAWYRCLLGTLKFVEDGDNWCRKITSLHPRTVADVEAKIAQLENYAPTKCETIRQLLPWGASPCQGCKFFPGGVQDPSVPNPISAGRRSAIAPQPTAAPITQPTELPPPLPAGATTAIQLVAPSVTMQAALIPQPPAPYERVSGVGIAVNRKDKDGNDQQSIIYTNDLYPIKRLVNDVSKTEQQVWRVVLPRIGAKEFIIDADALYDSKKFTTACANNGLYPNKADLPALQDYMVAYIKQLQRDLDAEQQANSLGWNDDFTTFTLPDKVLHADGTVRNASLTEGAKVATQHIGQRGTMQGQARSLRFYNHPQYIGNQFAILAGLAAVLFHMTGHHGAVVNMSGESGASKSTTLYTLASLWGHPKLWPINGTNRGATANARSQRMVVNGSLPTGVDEITHMPAKDAIDLAMSVSQPGQRLRLTQDGSERATGGATKATLMISTANSSLHSLISTDNAAGTAGSMRVFEMRFVAQQLHSKAEADEHLRDLEQNYGHIGPAFMSIVVRHRAAIEKRLQQVMREIDTEAGILSSERYWSAIIAAVIVAGELAVASGFVPYDIDAIRSWALKTQIPYMRGVVKEEYRDPLAVLTDYIAEKHGSILIVEKALPQVGQNTSGQFQATVKDFASNHIGGALLGHYDMTSGVLYLLKQGFKDHCLRAGGSSTKLLEELHAPRLMPDQSQRRIVVDKNTRRTLGAGTVLAKGQSWCFSVDMTHPDIAGFAPQPVAGSGTPTSAPAGQLRAVT